MIQYLLKRITVAWGDFPFMGTLAVWQGEGEKGTIPILHLWHHHLQEKQPADKFSKYPDALYRINIKNCTERSVWILLSTYCTLENLFVRWRFIVHARPVLLHGELCKYFSAHTSMTDRSVSVPVTTEALSLWSPCWSAQSPSWRYGGA